MRSCDASFLNLCVCLSALLQWAVGLSLRRSTLFGLRFDSLSLGNMRPAVLRLDSRPIRLFGFSKGKTWLHLDWLLRCDTQHLHLGAVSGCGVRV